MSLDKNKKSFCPWTKRVFSPTKLFLILVLIHTVHTQYYKVRVFYLEQLLQTELNPGITRVKRELSNSGLSFRTRKKTQAKKTQADLKLKLKLPKKLKEIIGKLNLPEIFFSGVAGTIFHIEVSLKNPCFLPLFKQQSYFL